MMKWFEWQPRRRSGLLLDLAAIGLGLVVTACAVAALVYLGTDVSKEYRDILQIALPLGIGVALLVVAALLLLPARLYMARRVTRVLADVASLILACAGALGVVLGGLWWILDEADPGHAGKLPSILIWAAATVALGCYAVLRARARKAAKMARRRSEE